MKRFAALVEALAGYGGAGHGGAGYGGSAAIRPLAAYLQETPEPERALALGLLSGAITFRAMTPVAVRRLALGRVEAELFAASAPLVGNVVETAALIWPGVIARGEPKEPPSLGEVVAAGATAEPGQIADWLDRLDAGGRLVLLRLVTGSLRARVSAATARAAERLAAGLEAEGGGEAAALEIAAVIVYARRGAVSVAVWRGDELVVVGEAALEGGDGDLAALELWIRRHTLASFGPVREVARGLVVTVGCDGVAPASRRKAGLVLSAARVQGVLWDTPIALADRLERLERWGPELKG